MPDTKAIFAAIWLDATRDQDDITRHVLIFGSKPVGNPTAKRRPTGELTPGVHLTDTAGVIDSIGPTRANHGDVGLGGDSPMASPQGAR